MLRLGPHAASRPRPTHDVDCCDGARFWHAGLHARVQKHQLVCASCRIQRSLLLADQTGQLQTLHEPCYFISQTELLHKLAHQFKQSIGTTQHCYKDCRLQLVPLYCHCAARKPVETYPLEFDGPSAYGSLQLGPFMNSARRRGFLHDISSRELGLNHRAWAHKLQSSRYKI